MTDDELDRLDALASAATRGPWLQGMWSGICERPDHTPPHPGPPECTYTQYLRTYREVLGYVSVDPDVTLIGGNDYGAWLSSSDAAFIAASREAIPALVAEIRRLRAGITDALEDYDHRDEISAIDRLRALVKRQHKDN